MKKSELLDFHRCEIEAAPAEIETIQAMQNHLAKLLDVVGSLAAHVTEAGAGALRYDGTVEGFPVRTTVYDGDKVASEITLRKVDHEPVDPALLTVPTTTQPQEIKLRRSRDADAASTPSPCFHGRRLRTLRTTSTDSDIHDS